MQTATPSITTTERLHLRELCHADLTFITGMLGNSEVTRFHHHPYTPEESAAWLERQLARYRNDKHGMWLVLNLKTGRPLGTVGLVNQNVDGAIETEIGYMIHRPHWQHGYATEAAFAMRGLARDQHGYNRVISLIRPENIASQGVARRLGMQPERTVSWRGFDHTIFAASL